ncbi:hypothetical protein BDC45DRAFT_77515 [Circinella umbellata]|nr:hypothetical protein BDC45DRAFT_77515 [Circinella umbellata]
MEIPPLCELSISHVHQNSINSYNNYHTGRADENDIDGTVDVRSERIRITPMTTNNDAENNHLASLIRLFEKYGEISKMEFVSLESIKLRYWDVVDPILIILADIKTLRTITLEGLLHVTIQGLLNLIKSFAEQNGEGRQHLSTIKLDRIKAVSDDVIIALKDIKSIRTIELDRLASITDKGIKGLVDNPNPHLLSNLKVRRCTHITKGCLRYIKQKIK